MMTAVNNKKRARALYLPPLPASAHSTSPSPMPPARRSTLPIVSTGVLSFKASKVPANGGSPPTNGFAIGKRPGPSILPKFKRPAGRAPNDPNGKPKIWNEDDGEWEIDEPKRKRICITRRGDDDGEEEDGDDDEEEDGDDDEEEDVVLDGEELDDDNDGQTRLRSRGTPKSAVKHQGRVNRRSK